MSLTLFHNPVTDPAAKRLELNLAVGWHAPNGAVILASKPSTRHDQPAGPRAFIVLCLSHNEFVTWVLFVNVDGSEGECFWGNYHHMDLAKGHADYLERT